MTARLSEPFETARSQNKLLKTEGMQPHNMMIDEGREESKEERKENRRSRSISVNENDFEVAPVIGAPLLPYDIPRMRSRSRDEGDQEYENMLDTIL